MNIFWIFFMSIFELVEKNSNKNQIHFTIYFHTSQPSFNPSTQKLKPNTTKDFKVNIMERDEFSKSTERTFRCCLVEYLSWVFKSRLGSVKEKVKWNLFLFEFFLTNSKKLIKNLINRNNGYYFIDIDEYVSNIYERENKVMVF